MLGSKLKKYAWITLGTALTAFAISAFYTPNKIVNGGVSGVATILFHTLGIPAGVSFFIINAVLLLIALTVLGKAFVVDTVFGSLMLSAFVQVFSYLPKVTDDIFLSAIFGSVLYGVGIGIALSQGGSTGGTDILSRLVQRFFPDARIGTLLLLVDSMVITASLIIFRKIDLALYGALALFISSYSVNRLIQKLNISKLAFVVTERGEELSRTLVTTSPRGITVLKATGAYTMEERHVLICAMKESETRAFREKILAIDPGAFVIFSESQQILGNGFRIYK